VIARQAADGMLRFQASAHRPIRVYQRPFAVIISDTSAVNARGYSSLLT